MRPPRSSPGSRVERGAAEDLEKKFLFLYYTYDDIGKAALKFDLLFLLLILSTISPRSVVVCGGRPGSNDGRERLASRILCLKENE